MRNKSFLIKAVNENGPASSLSRRQHPAIAMINSCGVGRILRACPTIQIKTSRNLLGAS